MKMTSFDELREYVGLKPLKEKKSKPVICKKCGAEMKKVATNMWYCGKEITDKENKTSICSYLYIRHLA